MPFRPYGFVSAFVCVSIFCMPGFSQKAIPDSQHTLMARASAAPVPGASGTHCASSSAVLYADPQHPDSVRQAMECLPASGGTVYIPPGTYTGPTSIPSGVSLVGLGNVLPPQIWTAFNGARFNSYVAGTGRQSLVQFTYSAPLTLENLSQIRMKDIVFDMGGLGNLSLLGVSGSEFDIAVVNVPPTLPAVVVDGTPTYNNANNHFGWLITEGGSEGVRIGNAVPDHGASTENTFDWIFVLADVQPSNSFTAIDFVGNCDSQVFHRIQFWHTDDVQRANGILFNSADSTRDTDANGIYIGWFDETGHPYTGNSITINPSANNVFRTGVLAGSTKISITPWSGNSSYSWDRLGDVIPSQAGQSLTVPVVHLEAGANGVPAIMFDKGGTTKWQIYVGIANELQFYNGTRNVASLDHLGFLHLRGGISSAVKTFQIDHPLDPSHRYLNHVSVESPDMMNLYSGVARLDAQGQAVVDMPSYFEALNQDFRYQLTSIGAPQPGLYIASEITHNRFAIAGGKPGAKVSWMVTGIRRDAYANAHRVTVEEDKPAAERGHYLYPELFKSGPSSAVRTPTP